MRRMAVSWLAPASVGAGYEQRYYTIPWPVSDYDSCPGLEQQ
jgi:hypothetical protein